MNRLDIKVILALPGVFLAVLGLVLAEVLRVPLPANIRLEILIPATLTAYFFAAALAAGFERHIPSFREAGGLLEGIVGRLQLTPAWAMTLSLTSAVGEEVFFRGFLLGLGLMLAPPWAAVIGQAIVFAAMHPAPRRAWAYPLWTLLIGVVFALVRLESGSLAPVILAHYIFNHENFNAVVAVNPEKP